MSIINGRSSRNFPDSCKVVKEVRQLDDQRLHWRADIAGVEKEWTAKITEQIPDDRIAWISESGEYTSGLVDFARLGMDRTRVALEIAYDPTGFIENAGEAVGLVSRRIGHDLERFKEFIESCSRDRRVAGYDQGKTQINILKRPGVNYKRGRFTWFSTE